VACSLERRRWFLGLGLLGLWTAGAPLLAGVFGPDPTSDRLAYRRGPLALFAELDAGRDAARHIPSRMPDPLHALAGRIAEYRPADTSANIDGHELWLDDPDRCVCTDEARANRLVGNDWPFQFQRLAWRWRSSGSQGS
jgi:hypothetical protein